MGSEMCIRDRENIFSDDMLLKISPGDDIPDFSDFVGSKTDHVIFDLGGYPDTRLVNIIAQCAYVIVPLTNETYNLDIGVNSINEIAALNQNIVIVANKTTKNDFAAIEQQVRRFFAYPMFNIKKSSVMQKMMETGLSIATLTKQATGKPYKRFYQLVDNQFNKLIEHISDP